MACTKQLEGVQSTKELRSLLQAVSKLRTELIKEHLNDGSDASVVTRASAMLPSSEVRSILAKYDEQKNKETIPLRVVKVMRFILCSDKGKLKKLEGALAETTLVFTAPPPVTAESDEQRRYKKRMNKLKLKAEETKYSNLVSNLDTTVEDDMNAKSMTYAASIGLNMIVAPISFGVFMYFFAGPIFDMFFGKQDIDPRKADIRSVIAGVISGVAMLFIEMILFVIRTHEFERALAKKKRKKSISPFGYAKPKATE